MSLTEKMTTIESETTALLSYANGVTGSSDTRLGDAVKTLADGYGKGGGDVRKVVVDIVPDADMAITPRDTLEAATGVDEIPDMIVMYCPNLQEWINAHAESLPTTQTVYSGMFLRLPLPYKQFLTSTVAGMVDGEFAYSGAGVLAQDTNRISLSLPTSNAYCLSTYTDTSYTNRVEKGKVKIPYVSNGRYARAGLIYRFVCLYGII